MRWSRDLEASEDVERQRGGGYGVERSVCGAVVCVKSRRREVQVVNFSSVASSACGSYQTAAGKCCFEDEARPASQQVVAGGLMLRPEHGMAA